MFRNYAIATIALTAAFAAPAAAGMLTMTANNASGADDWSTLSEYTMVLTITTDDLNTAGSAGSFTLTGWDFQAFNKSGMQVFAANGSATSFSASGSGPIFNAQIALDPGNITTNILTPKANFLQFSYEFVGSSMTLAQAIFASAGRDVGQLTLATTVVGSSPVITTGDLVGTYAVPAPSALALIGVGGLMGRRRRN
jgi:hypothetical protein